ncbi:unnamed protein product [Timema podura]|uniref:Uncharacterized protein n=1 Tax=Timema podura TaxID=61482 RepID=A0ABN7P491_TIMPD|nr:unnamed protein product [Timema podura]
MNVRHGFVRRNTRAREKEGHLAHLQRLEEELDVQVAQVEEQAREEARSRFEAEKRNLEDRLETETAELQAHLRLFQKMNLILSRGKEKGQDQQIEIATENLELRTALSETRTNMAMLRSEMAHLRSEYEEKTRMLDSQQERVVAYMHQNSQVHQQLQMLQ